MKPILSLQIAALGLAGMVSAMSLIFFAGGDNCWEGITDVSSDISPRGTRGPFVVPSSG